MSETSDCPWPVLVLAVVAIAFFALPFLGLLWKAPWGDAWSILTSDSARAALRLSLICSSWATAIALVLGVPLAWLLARVSFPGRRLVRALCTLSMVLPPVVAGVALFYALGRRGSRRPVPRPVVRLHVCRSPLPASSWPRRSWPRRSSSSRSRPRSASSTRASRTPPARSARPAGTRSGASCSRPSARARRRRRPGVGPCAR